MSLHTTERDLKKIFGEYGEIDTVQIVYDRISRRSRGFGFVYFMTTKDAARVSFAPIRNFSNVNFRQKIIWRTLLSMEWKFVWIIL